MNEHAPDPQPRTTVLLEGSGPRLVDPNYIDGEEMTNSQPGVREEVNQDEKRDNLADHDETCGCSRCVILRKRRDANRMQNERHKNDDQTPKSRFQPGSCSQ